MDRVRLLHDGPRRLPGHPDEVSPPGVCRLADDASGGGFSRGAWSSKITSRRRRLPDRYVDWQPLDLFCSSWAFRAIASAGVRADHSVRVACLAGVRAARPTLPGTPESPRRGLTMPTPESSLR